MKKSGTYLCYNHLLTEEFLNLDKLSLEIGALLSISSINEKKEDQLDSDLVIDIFSIYFSPTYSIGSKFALSYTFGYNIISSDNFKSKGGLLCGIGFYYKINKRIIIGIQKVSNIIRLKYNYSHYDYYNATLGNIERNSELKLKRTKPLPDSYNTLENCMNLKLV